MLSRLIDLSVHRRIAVLVLAGILTVFGIQAYRGLSIEAFPDVTNAQVQVITQMPGYAAAEVERQVSIPLERALNGTPGMTVLRSENLFGLSIVTLVFDDKADPFASRMIVSQRIGDAELPAGVTPMLGPESTPLGKIYRFRVTSDRHDLFARRSEMQWTVTRVLRQVQGVADVVPFGGFLKELNVQADPGKLYAAGLTLRELQDAISKANANVGGGFLRQGDQELTVRGIGLIQSPEDIKRIPLKAEDGTALTVGDVATIQMVPTPRRGSVAYNGQREEVEGLVLMRRGENPSLVLDGIHQQVERLNTTILPKGMKIVPVYDRSNLVSHTVSTVQNNLLHGFLLVVVVVWLFLRSLVGSSIVAVVIPLSLLTAFIGLSLLGLPANLISMGAIDFGIIVDGAVVLVETVMHGIAAERPATRKDILKLVIVAATDVGRPIFFSMLIIIAALLPVFTLQSVEGRLFRPLALTYAFALTGALAFSLTVVPALCAVLFQPKHANIVEPAWIDRLRLRYRRLLDRVLQRRPLALAAAAGLLAIGALSVNRVGTEFLPELDEGDIAIFVEMPNSIAMGKAQDVLQQIHARILGFSEVRDVHSEHGRPEEGTDNEGVNMVKTFVRLKPQDEWTSGRSKAGLIDAMRASLATIPGVRFNFSQPIKDSVEEAVAGVRGKVVLKIYGTDLDAMRQTLLRAKEAIQAVRGVTELDLYRDALSPQLRIQLDRAALARANVPIQDAEQTIETALAGRIATEYWEDERPVPVRLMLPLPSRDDLDKVAALQIATPTGGRVPLSQLARIEVASGPTTIVREGNVRFLALKFNVEGRDMGSTVNDAIAAVNAKVTPPKEHYFVWGGEFENQQRATKRLEVVVPIALLLVLCLLYAAMNSGRSALAIVATIPFALTGGAVALLVAGVPLSVSAAIGFIALLGQVSLMGVLVLSAAEQRRRAGAALLPALLDGAVDRLRPVLMASSLAMLGLMPMVVSTGIGSETQRPFALVVVGGMATTLIVALLILPVIYSYITPGQLITPEEADK